MRRLALIAALLVPGAEGALAAQVAVVPLEAVGVPASTADAATAELASALAAVDNVEVVDIEQAGRRLGLDLLRRARSCERELFCLVEVGELLRADRVVVGRIVRSRGASELGLELTMVDVAAAAEERRLTWRVPDLFEGALGDALGVAARRLVASPDARLRLELVPAEARVELFGEALARPPGAVELPLHSGNYFVRLSAPGHRPMDLRLVVPRGGEPTPLHATLDVDRLPALAPGAAGRAAPAPGSAGFTGFARPLPWVVVGLGVGAVVTGGLVMGSARADYGALSGQLRYTPGVTLPASAASRERDELRARHEVGGVTLVSGAVAAAAALAWMAIEAALEGGDDR